MAGMEGTTGLTPEALGAWGNPIGADRLARPAILVVEDDPDIREMLAMLLDMAGFSVTPRASAEDGLAALREDAFDLILTDFALPRRSGVWLLEHAEAEGLMQSTPALIVTAHPDVPGTAPYEVIQKPFDLDDLVERVRFKLEGEGPRRRRTASPRTGNSSDNGGTPDCPDPVELILYVSSRSPRSFAALKDIKNTLRRFKSSRFKLTICDVPPAAGPAARDCAPRTPALVRPTAGPRTFILGHITSPELLLELLSDCEVDLS